MQQSLELFKQFGEYAAQHEALPIDPEPQDELKQKFESWENGSNTQKKGTAKPTPATGQAGGAPVIGITAPQGIHTSTPESLVSYAGKNVDTVAQQHLQQTVGQRFNLNAGKGISLFAHEEGMKAIAHRGKMLIQSQHDDTVINAERNVTVTASQGKITYMANTEIINLVAGGAYIKLDGPNIEVGVPADYTVKAASHDWVGPASLAATMQSWDAGDYDEGFILRWPFDNEPIRNRRFELTRHDGSMMQGQTDGEGRANLQKSAFVENLGFKILPEE